MAHSVYGKHVNYTADISGHHLYTGRAVASVKEVMGHQFSAGAQDGSVEAPQAPRGVGEGPPQKIVLHFHLEMVHFCWGVF